MREREERALVRRADASSSKPKARGSAGFALSTANDLAADAAGGADHCGGHRVSFGG
jgi:hypothetical protein